MKKLTVVMPFLNEEFEPINTIISMNNTADCSEFEIIAICDAPEYKFEEAMRRFTNVRFVKNATTIGLGACRSMGINTASAPVVLVIDAHMRFSNDDWVNKIYNAAMEHPKTLWCTRSYVLRDTMTVQQLSPYKDVLSIAVNYAVGATILFDKSNKKPYPLSLKWITKSSFLDNYSGYVPCVLGANYFGNTQWLRKIRSFEGLLSWGFSEQHVSIKNWLLGGDCRGLDTVAIGHIFRTTRPYRTDFSYLLYNILFTANVLFAEELDFFNDFMYILESRYVDNSSYKSALNLLNERRDIVNIYKHTFLANKQMLIVDYLKKFNIFSME
jgi:glycosyltransferase involved in cell wall biosynthesis